MAGGVQPRCVGLERTNRSFGQHATARGERLGERSAGIQEVRGHVPVVCGDRFWVCRSSASRTSSTPFFSGEQALAKPRVSVGNCYTGHGSCVGDVQRLHLRDFWYTPILLLLALISCREGARVRVDNDRDMRILIHVTRWRAPAQRMSGLSALSVKACRVIDSARWIIRSPEDFAHSLLPTSFHYGEVPPFWTQDHPAWPLGAGCWEVDVSGPGLTASTVVTLDSIGQVHQAP